MAPKEECQCPECIELTRTKPGCSWLHICGSCFYNKKIKSKKELFYKDGKFMCPVHGEDISGEKQILANENEKREKYGYAHLRELPDAMIMKLARDQAHTYFSIDDGWIDDICRSRKLTKFQRESAEYYWNRIEEIDTFKLQERIEKGLIRAKKLNDLGELAKAIYDKLLTSDVKYSRQFYLDNYSYAKNNIRFF